MTGAHFDDTAERLVVCSSDYRVETSIDTRPY